MTDGAAGLQRRLERYLRSSLASSVGASVLTGVVGQLALVVSGVILARSLSTENRGYVALLTVVPSVIVQIGTLGVPLAVTFWIATRPAGAGALLRSLRMHIVSLGLALFVIGLLVSYALAKGRGQEIADATMIAALIIPASVSLQFGLAALQGLRRYTPFNLVRLAPGLLWVLFVATLFSLNVIGVRNLLLAWVLASAIPAVAIWIYLVGRLTWDSEAETDVTPSQLVRFGSRALIGNLAPFEGLGIDQLVIALALSPAELGIYVVGSTLCNIVRFVAQSIGFVAYPHIASLDHRDRWVATVRFTALSAALVGALVILLEVAAGFLVPLFFSSRYVDAVPVARVMLLASYVFGVRRVLINCLRGADRPTDGTSAELIALAVLLAFAFWPVRAPSAVAAAYAMLASGAVSLIALVVVAWLRMRLGSDTLHEATPMDRVTRG